MALHGHRVEVGHHFTCLALEGWFSIVARLLTSSVEAFGAPRIREDPRDRSNESQGSSLNYFEVSADFCAGTEAPRLNAGPTYVSRISKTTASATPP